MKKSKPLCRTCVHGWITESLATEYIYCTQHGSAFYVINPIKCNRYKKEIVKEIKINGD